MSILLDSDRLGQVPGEIDVEALADREPVGHELQRNDVEETLEGINSLRDLDLLDLVGREFWVVLVADDDGVTLASDDLLVGVEGLGEDVVASQDHDDREVLVDQSEHAVLQFTRHDGLAVKVRDFLDLQGTFKSGGVLSTTAEKEHALLILELLAELLDRRIKLEDLLKLIGNLAKALHNLLSPLLLGRAIVGQRQGKHDHADELGSVRLGGGNTDFGAGVDVNTTMGEQGDGGTDHVDDTNGQGATLQAIAESHERISSLTRLRDENASVITEDGCLPVQEIRCQLDGDWNFHKLFEDTAYCHARVVARTASNEDDSAASADGVEILAETTKGDNLILNIETTTHGVDNGFGLLEDFLLHEVIELALHDFLQLDLDGLDGTDVGGGTVVLLETVNVEGALVNVSDVVVLEVQDLLGVLDDGGGIRGQEELGGLWSAVI